MFSNIQPLFGWYYKNFKACAFSLLLTLFTLLSINVSTPTVHAADYTVEQWRVVELSFTSKKNYRNPFLAVDMWATFSGPDGMSIKRPAFWDGGNIWKVRFAPTQQGLWSYTTSATDTRDSGLHNKSGVIQSIVYTGELDIYKHGFLKRSTNNRYLTYADDKPFFWLGDDLTIFHKARLNKSNKTVWNPVVANPSSQWKGIVDRRVTQGYTIAHVALLAHLAQTGLYWQQGMVGKLLNTDYFRKDIDPKVAYLVDRGLVCALAVGFHADVDDARYPNDTLGGAEPLKKLAKYVVARYGAYPMIWAIVEPDQFNDQTRIDRWRGVGLEFNTHDTYNHPQTVWYWGTAYGNKPTYYLNDSPRWVDAIIHQCGHGSSASAAMWPTSQYTWYYDNYPKFPLVEAGGCNFEQINAPNNDEIVRWSLYRAVQAGSFGAGYGAQGIWNMVWDNNDTTDDFGLQHRNWFDAIDYPGGYQMNHLKTFYTDLPWHELVPRPRDWATWNLIQFEFQMPVLKASEGGKVVTVFFPTAYNTRGSVGTLHNLSAASYTAKWFNPRTGAYIPISTFITPTNGNWTVPKKPQTADWLLQVVANSAPSK